WVFRAVFRHDRRGRLLDRFGDVVPEVTPAALGAAVKAPVAAKEMYRKPYETAEALKKAEDEFRESYKGVPVHHLDIHIEKGMHCVDCHFVQDMHGNTRLQMEVRAGCEIQCVDCHGTADKRATLRTSGPASYTSSPDGTGRDLLSLRTPFNQRRFEYVGNRVFQNSMVERGLRWEVTQTADVIDP